MFAVFYDQYGEASVLQAGPQPDPHAQAGQIRIAVQSTAVNPWDCKMRSGALAARVPVQFPVIPGVEAAGVVDEIGDGVVGVSIGDEVFGMGTGTTAEYAVLDHWTVKPEKFDWQQAAAAAAAAETAVRLMALLNLQPEQTIVIDNGAGSVGQALAQLARLDRITVIGTAGPANQQRLRDLGAIPLAYGPGLLERVRAVTERRIDAAIDAAGRGSLPELVEITASPEKVVTIADANPSLPGVRTSTERSAWSAFQRVADLAQSGAYDVAIDQGFHFTSAADAHRRVEAGHLRGKVVFGG